MRYALLAAFLLLSLPVAAQTTDCEIVLMPVGGAVAEGQFADAGQFMNSVYDEDKGHLTETSGLPVRAVMCRREALVPTMRDYPILKTGLPLSVSQDFDSTSSGLLTIYDAGAEYKAEYSGPPLSPETEKRLRDTLEIFNFQKLAE